MTWRTTVPCPRKCGGALEAYQAEGLTTKERAVYHFVCTKCRVEGTWKDLALTLYPRRPGR